MVFGIDASGIKVSIDKLVNIERNTGEDTPSQDQVLNGPRVIVDEISWNESEERLEVKVRNPTEEKINRIELSVWFEFENSAPYHKWPLIARIIGDSESKCEVLLRYQLGRVGSSVDDVLTDTSVLDSRSQGLFTNYKVTKSRLMNWPTTLEQYRVLAMFSWRIRYQFANEEQWHFADPGETPVQEIYLCRNASQKRKERIRRDRYSYTRKQFRRSVDRWMSELLTRQHLRPFHNYQEESKFYEGGKEEVLEERKR